MAVRNYVLSKYMAGLSVEDIEVDIHQMMEGEDYFIEDPVYYIAEDIYNSLYSFIDPVYTEDMIYTLLSDDGSYKIATYDVNGMLDVDYILLFSDNDQGLYYYDLKGSFISRHSYTVNTIDDDELVYFVSEHIINPDKDCDHIERIYVPYFMDVFAARQYQNRMMLNYDPGRGKPNSGFRIFVADARSLSSSEWYRLNLKAYKYIEDYKLNPEAYRYISDISFLTDSILSDVYDRLPAKERIDYDVSLFNKFKDYIPERIFSYLEDDLLFCLSAHDDAGVRSACDHAIVSAISSAASLQEFFDVQNVLGNDMYRLGMMTDDIYNSHPDDGYIVVTKDGDFGWYDKSCYAINEWKGSIDSEYHGVFQKNEKDVLLSLREFRPEMFVDRLPDKSDIEHYDHLYKNALKNERLLHTEMVILKNVDGDDVVVGTWYPSGVESEVLKEKTMFFRDYNKYMFTKDECKLLLNGEEVVINNYLTKIGSEIIIRGKLMDVSSALDTKAKIEFVRTDIDLAARLKMDKEVGVSEPSIEKKAAVLLKDQGDSKSAKKRSASF